MSPKCPQCGYQPPKGRPKELDDAKVKKLVKQGLSNREIARQLEVSEGAVRLSRKRR